MTIEKIKALAKEIHEGNVKRGFWDNERSLSEVLMLIRTEMSEAVEADRKGRNANTEKYKKLEKKDRFSTVFFSQIIKDTVEDELADVVIRILDSSVAGLFDEKHFISSLEYYKHNMGFINRWYESLIDFAEFWNYHFPFSGEFNPDDLSDSLVQVLGFCEQANIDI